jgi:hypothetical protein
MSEPAKPVYTPQQLMDAIRQKLNAEREAKKK